MKAILSATALAGALALMPLAALAQQQPGQPQMPETQAAPTPEAKAPDAQASDAPEDYRVITSAEDLEGFDAAEVRVEPVSEVPRDQVMAINSSLDPANQEAAALREELTKVEGVEQALSEENAEEERIVGAAIEGEELVVYILPEGQTREQWGAQMPAPSGEAQPGAPSADQPGATGADQQSGEPGAASGSEQRSQGGSKY